MAAPASLDEHPDVPVNGFHHSNPDLPLLYIPPGRDLRLDSEAPFLSVMTELFFRRGTCIV